MAGFQESISGVLGDVIGSTTLIALAVVIIVLVVGAVGGLSYYFFIYKKKFDIIVKVRSRRSGKDVFYFDKAAILNDKKNHKRYLKLWTTNMKLEMPKFNIFENTNWGDYIEVQRNSQMDIRFLTPPEVSRKYFIKHDGKLYPYAEMRQYEIENDISWILQSEKDNKKMIDPESIIMQLLAYAPQIISGALSFMVIFVIFKYAPQMFNEMQNIILELKKETEPEIIGGLFPLLLNIFRFRK